MEEIKSDPKTAPASQPVVKPLEEKALPVFDKAVLLSKRALIIYLVVILLGAVSGGIVYGLTASGTARVAGKRVQVIRSETEEGVKDAAAFKDTATGKLVANDGAVTKEGTHIIVRGDQSQNVYLTSSVVDLTKYEGKQIQVWGDTYQAQTAGWLMDVGRVKIVE